MNRKKIVIIIFIMFFVAVFCFFNRKQSGEVDIRNYENLLFSHRGAFSEYQENTREAIQESLNLGFKAIEIDISLTKDNKVILFHDEENADRLLGIRKHVQDMYYEEIKKYPILKYDKETPFHVCTLEDVYDLTGDSIYLYLDLKNANFKLANEVIKIIEEKKAEKRTLVADGNVFILRHVKLKNPKISTVLEGFSAEKKWTYWLLWGNLKPDYFSGAFEKIDLPYAQWLKKKKLQDSFILYSVDSTNVNRAKELNFKNMIIEDVAPEHF